MKTFIKTKCIKCNKELEILNSVFYRKTYVSLCDKCKLEFFIDSLTDNIPSNVLSVKFVCKNCGKTVILHKQNLKNKKQLLCKHCQSEKTCLEKYGVKNAGGSEESLNKIKKTKLEKYGDEFYTNRKKYKQTMIDRYGVESNFAMESVIKAKKKTYLEHYGVDNVSKSDYWKEKVKETNRKKFGTDWATQSYVFKENVKKTCLEKYNVEQFSQSEISQQYRRQRYFYDGIYFDSKSELYFYIWCVENNFNIKRNLKSFDYYVDNKLHKYFPDFDINGNLYEIKGKQFLKEDGTWQNPYNHSQDEFYEAKHQCALKNGVNIIYDFDKYEKFVNEKYTKDYVGLFKIGVPFPYLNEDLKDKSDIGIIRHFHKSIYEATKLGKPSPLEAWEDKEIIKKVALNRLKYIKRCKPSDILQGFSVTRFAPKISLFRPSLAENLIRAYLNDFSEIFDPFSGFSGRLLGAFNCKKTYIGQDINKKHVQESNSIIEYKNIINAKVTQQDILSDVEKSYECLFTCPPYGGKEHWNENNDEVEKSCDEWIGICLQKYKCKKYLFVVDKTEKYKDKIVQDSIGKKIGLFHKKNELVLLI